MSGDVASLARVLALPALESLSVRQLRVLLYFAEGPSGCLLAGTVLGIAPADVSRAVDALELAGLLERGGHQVRVTSLGSDVADEIEAALRPLSPAAAEEV